MRNTLTVSVLQMQENIMIERSTLERATYLAKVPVRTCSERLSTDSKVIDRLLTWSRQRLRTAPITHCGSEPDGLLVTDCRWTDIVRA